MGIQRLSWSSNTSGNNEIVAAQDDLPITLLAAYFHGDGNVHVYFSDGSNALTGAVGLTNTKDWLLPYNPVGWVEAPGGSGLYLNHENGTLVKGVIVVNVGGRLPLI